jgi:multidrug efflux pump subunit AcrA (membrane-fusion protein)
MAAASQLPPPALAHGGHDHAAPEDDAKAPAASGTAVVLAKKSQLLLGLRSIATRKTPVPRLLKTFGHVVPKPQNDALIVAPQAGFLRGLRGAVLGLAVKRGEVLGHLQAVASVPLVSPIDGVVTEIEAVEGARVEPGAKILRVTDRSVLWVDAKLFQSQLAALGQVTSIVVDIEGQPAAITGTMVQAPTPFNEETRTAKVFIELSEAPKELRIGSFASINFVLDSQTEGVVLPGDAVLNRGGERLVFVKTGPETFEPRSVTVIDGADPRTVVVTGGLEGGDRVVTTGNYQLLMKAR